MDQAVPIRPQPSEPVSAEGRPVDLEILPDLTECREQLSLAQGLDLLTQQRGLDLLANGRDGHAGADASLGVVFQSASDAVDIRFEREQPRSRCHGACVQEAMQQRRSVVWNCLHLCGGNRSVLGHAWSDVALLLATLPGVQVRRIQPERAGLSPDAQPEVEHVTELLNGKAIHDVRLAEV
jgi:hypothetical protein